MNTKLVKDHLQQIILIRKNVAELQQSSKHTQALRDYRMILIDKISYFNTQENEKLVWARFITLSKLETLEDKTHLKNNIAFSELKEMTLPIINQHIDLLQDFLQEQSSTPPVPFPKVCPSNEVE